MLAKFSNDPAWQNSREIIFKKTAYGEDASLCGAFSRRTLLTFSLQIPRNLGICEAFLRIAPDGDVAEELPLRFSSSDCGKDTYSVKLSLEKLCRNEPSGLFYYDFRLQCGEKTLFTSEKDVTHFSLSENEGKRSRLLVFEDGFETPDWFHGGVIYHIFVDRFARGSFTIPVRDDAVLNEDWESGVPQYGEYPGAFVPNNMFFGGNLIGIREKLDYISSLGVTVIYLSPIFKAYSNHKYDTGDYMKVDEMFGGDKALADLISEAKKYGIRIILDGVFNHTGDDSLYFNKYGKYTSVGAYQSEKSPYHDWFTFTEFPDKYESWWGIPILPKLNLSCPSCRDFLAGKGKNSVVGKYTSMGIGGWRLDVADELSDEFLDLVRSTAKSESKGDAVIIGEVWENASDKIAYGKRRRYLRGSQLDSVMNYPFRSAVIEYLLSGNAEALAAALTEIYASYPKTVCDSLMNLLGTHDTERILTVLGGENKYDLPNSELAHVKMSAENKNRAILLLKLASAIQFTVYGIPSVFYGDEAGLEGYRDPFCRMPFPWGKENSELLYHYRALGKLRKENPVFADGTFRVLEASGAYLLYERRGHGETVLIVLNAGKNEIMPEISGTDMLTGEFFSEEDVLPPVSFRILKINKEEADDEKL